MLNYIWSAMLLGSVICALTLGKGEALALAMVDSTGDAIELILTLTGAVCLWSGLMKIAQESGLTRFLARFLAPVLHPLFPKLDRNGEAFSSISMNITANLLGLGNTATPFGLKAMSQLRELSRDKDTASDEMVIFVVMNTASLQLVPTMLGSLRQSYGSAEPFAVVPAVWLSSATALAVALIIAVLGNKRRKRL